MAASSKRRILLGIPDQPIEGDRLSPFDSKLGGLPDCFAKCVLDEMPVCPVCDKRMRLYAQLYCPLEGSPYHRTFHCFCCSSKQCWTESSGWCVLRSQEVDPSYTRDPPPTPKVNQHCSLPTPGANTLLTNERGATMATAGVTVWCDDADDWGESRDVPSKEVAAVDLLHETHEDHQTCPNNVENGSDACVNEAPTDTKIVRDMDSLTIANCRGTESEPSFPSFYLDVMVEPPAENLSSTECFSAETRAAMDVFQAERMKDERGMVKGMVQGGEPYGGEQYEKGVASHGDGTFHKFYKRISRCPSQVLRYCHGGEPLLVSAGPTPQSSAPPTCQYCGAVRVFEFQFMPSLVYFFQNALDGLNLKQPMKLYIGPHEVPEYGTVLVYTCSQSCWEGSVVNGGNSFRQEWALVQPDPEESLMDCLQI